MSLRTPHEEYRLSSKTSAKRLEAVLATGLVHTSTLVPKLSFDPPSSTPEVEAIISGYVYHAVMAIVPNLVADLQSLNIHGYIKYDSLIQLAQNAYIPMLGELTATAKITKVSHEVYVIKINAVVTNGPYGLACKEVETLVDMRRLSQDILRTQWTDDDDDDVPVTREQALQALEHLRQIFAHNREYRELIEAITGNPVEIGVLSEDDPVGPMPLYAHILSYIYEADGDDADQLSGLTVLLVSKALIELEKTFLMALLGIAYAPDQVLGIMNQYDARNIFDFMHN